MKATIQKTMPIVTKALAIVAFLAMSYLTFAQIFKTQIGYYTSDWPQHLEFIVNGDSASTYSLFHLVLIAVYKFFDSYDIMAFIASLMVIFSNLLSYLLVRKYLLSKLKVKHQYTVELICLSLFLVSMIIVKLPFFQSVYLGVGTPNIWHNPTFSVARPFSISSLILIAKANEQLEANEKYYKTLILFAISLFISVLMKPSFFFVFLPALFLYYLYKLIKSKFKLFKDCFFFGLSVVPAGLVLIVQNMILFSGDNSIVIDINGILWNSFAPSGLVSVAILLATAFPLYVTITNIKKLNFEHIVVLLTCIFGILEAYFLAENGPRFSHGNFFWGYYFALFLAFLVSAITFFNNKQHSIPVKIIGYILFFTHLICGIVYFIQLLFGVLYL